MSSFVTFGIGGTKDGGDCGWKPLTVHSNHEVPTRESFGWVSRQSNIPLLELPILVLGWDPSYGRAHAAGPRHSLDPTGVFVVLPIMGDDLREGPDVKHYHHDDR